MCIGVRPSKSAVRRLDKLRGARRRGHVRGADARDRARGGAAQRAASCAMLGAGRSCRDVPDALALDEALKMVELVVPGVVEELRNMVRLFKGHGCAIERLGGQLLVLHK